MKIIHLDQLKAQSLSHDTDIVKKILFGEKDLPASVRLSHAVLKPGQRASAHAHADLCEVFYVLSGQAVFCIDGEKQKLRAGSSIRIDPHEVHAVSNHGDDDLNLLYFGLMT
ncbi:MAG: cupin domain-containing protein [Mariprofundaceae bacterium]